jgi:YidC/Oxa1 family membrane protein insertase
LNYLNSFANDYGIALILLGVVTKIIISPFYIRQTKLMLEMQKRMNSLRPYLLSIEKKYKDKPEEMFKKQLELYQTLGFNPLQGCFTTMILSFIQIPILFGVFFAVKKEIDTLKGISFLWIKSLASSDALLFLLYILSMYLSFKITPSYYNSEQEKKTSEMFQLMMLTLFALIFWGFPSAFILYWFSFNIVGIIVSFVVHKLIKIEDIDKEKLKNFELDKDVASLKS